MERELLFEEDGYQMYKEYEMDEEFFQMMERVSLGTSKTRYHHYYSREHLGQIPAPYFFTARCNGRLHAAVTFCQRTISNRGRKNSGAYIRYFAAGPEMRGRGLVGKFSKTVMKCAIAQEEQQTAFYAAIEARNTRVRKVVHSVGFSELCAIKTVGFSRFFPKAHEGVRALNKDEFTAFLPRLAERYAHHAFWMTDNLFVDKDYFVLEEGGRIVAGVQAHRAHWSIEKLPGLIGWLLPAIPYLPLINRIFNPRSFRFLTFEGFFVEPGYEGRLQGLMEALLARYGLHSAVFWFDERDPFYSQLLKHNRMGLLQHFVGGSEARFIVNLKGFSEEEAGRLKEAPFYISGHDNI